MNKSGYIILNNGLHQVGLQDADGKEIIPCIYDRIMDFDDDGYIRLIKDGIYTTIDLAGNICIQPELNLTHLGVFHSGSARARKGKTWGLVNVYGKEITPFEYKGIDAFRYGTRDYIAVNGKKEKGILTPDGTFTPFKKAQSHPTPVVPPPPAIVAPTPMPIHSPTPPVHPQKVKVFDQEKFVMNLRHWLNNYSDAFHFYYLDTDAPIPIKKSYKKGQILRAGRYIEVSDHLLRPVTKTRFIIASHNLPDRENIVRNIRNAANLPFFEGNIIYPKARFVVLDIYPYAGITQILLLHLPIYAIRLALQHQIKLTQIRFYDNKGRRLSQAARLDLQTKLSDMVHGISLSPEWQKKMYHPIGLDEDFQPLSFDSDETLPDENVQEYASIISFLANDNEYDWKEDLFWKEVDFNNKK